MISNFLKAHDTRILEVLKYMISAYHTMSSPIIPGSKRLVMKQKTCMMRPFVWRLGNSAEQGSFAIAALQHRFRQRLLPY
jgi:hypothetical protein